MKPAITSTTLTIISRKNVDVPACRTSRNSISMTTNSTIDRTWSTTERTPIRVAFKISSGSRMIARPISMSSAVTLQVAPEVRFTVVTVSVQFTPGVRNTIML